MTSTFIPYARQNITDEDCKAVIQALKADVITRGSFVEQFEKAIAAFCNVQYAVSFHSGTTALHAAYFAANANSSHQILTTPNTFVGTFVGAIQLGANLKFIDIDRETGNMDLRLIENSPLENAIIVPVHFSGIPVDIKTLRGIAPRAIIIEDAAHALGSFHKNGRPVGSCDDSDMTVLSFHPAKTITTGEGGLVTTNDKHLYERLRLFRNNGITRHDEAENFPGFYSVQMATGNYNFTDFQAALGTSQLCRVKEFVAKRERLISIYRNELKDYPLRFFSKDFDAISAHHIAVVQIDFESVGITRKQVMLKLKEKNIGTQVHYIPAYRHPLLRESHPHLPEMENYYRQALTLPLYVDLEPEHIQKICSELIKILGYK